MSVAFPLALLTALVGLVFPAGAIVLGEVAGLLTWYIIHVVVWLDDRGAIVVMGVPSIVGQMVLWGFILGAIWALNSEGRRTWHHFANSTLGSRQSIVGLMVASLFGAIIAVIWVSGR